MSWGILVRYFGEAVDHHTLDFVREFGLILFVFTIGLQVRPGLIAALRQQGVKLTMLAAAIVIPGAAGVPLADRWRSYPISRLRQVRSGGNGSSPSWRC